MNPIPEKSNLPPLKRRQRRHEIPVEPPEEQEDDSPKNRSSRMKKLVRNSAEKKSHHHHYPGSTPINDNFDAQSECVVEFTNENGKHEVHGRIIPPKVSKKSQGWRHLLQKRPKPKPQPLPFIDDNVNSDDLDEIIKKNGNMVFSSDGEDRKKREGEKEEERLREEERWRKEKERRQIEEEKSKLQLAKENAMKELQNKRAKEAEEASKR